MLSVSESYFHWKVFDVSSNKMKEDVDIESTGKSPARREKDGCMIDEETGVEPDLIDDSGTKYRCEVCGKGFSIPARLNRHFRTHTGERPWKCEVCGKLFAVKENLSVHLRVHTKERPYSCDICGRAFEHSGKLHRHRRIHTGERPHRCPTCGKDFIQSGQLVIHQRSHTGEKPFVCRTCDKGFTCSKQLKVHQRTHTGEKPYSCTVCNKSFGYNHVLKFHLMSHYGEKYYKCTNCNESFTSRETLKRHLKDCRLEAPAASTSHDVTNRKSAVVEPEISGPPRPVPEVREWGDFAHIPKGKRKHGPESGSESGSLSGTVSVVVAPSASESVNSTYLSNIAFGSKSETVMTSAKPNVFEGTMLDFSSLLIPSDNLSRVDLMDSSSGDVYQTFEEYPNLTEMYSPKRDREVIVDARNTTFHSLNPFVVPECPKGLFHDSSPPTTTVELSSYTLPPETGPASTNQEQDYFKTVPFRKRSFIKFFDESSGWQSESLNPENNDPGKILLAPDICPVRPRSQSVIMFAKKVTTPSINPD